MAVKKVTSISEAKLTLTNILTPPSIFSPAGIFHSLQNLFQVFPPRHVGLVVSVATPHAVGRVFAPRPGHTKDHNKTGTNCLPAWHTCGRVGI